MIRTVREMLVKRKQAICAHRKRERTTNEAFALRRGKKSLITWGWLYQAESMVTNA